MLGRLALAVAILVGGLAIGLLTYERLFPAAKPETVVRPYLPSVVKAQPPAPAGGDAGVAEPRAVVAAASGRVERRRGGGDPVAVRAGDLLDLADVIRTGDDGSATVELGGARVTVDPHSVVSVLELATKSSRLRLTDGRIAADVNTEGATMKVEVAHSDAIANAGRGRFSVLTSGAGHVTVASTDGDVALSAHGRSVTVGAGQLSVVAPDQPPSAPAPIPSTLFLKMAGAKDATAQREKTATVQGSTVPGAIIGVGGVRVVAGRDGAFTASVPLREGANNLVVQVQDVTGRREKRSLATITVDSAAPLVKQRVTW